jgi:glycogen phosphorylase
MDIAEHLVHGIDVWLNTPRRPWEASGTSGMKVLVNGGLNLSELDGWWAEGYSPDIGWALGDRLEHDSDPGWDAYEAERLYELLETEVLPEFYDRDEQGIPRKWVARVRESMARLVPEFSTNRMMKDYLDLYYLPAAAAYRQRTYAGGLPQGDPLQPSAHDLVAGIGSWHTLLDERWHEIRFLDYSLTEEDGPQGRSYEARIRVDLGQIPPDAVLVQLFAEPLDGGAPERHTLITDLAAMKKRRGAGTQQPPQPGEYAFKVVFASERPAGDYTPRVVPGHRFAQVPLEAGHILWYR